MADPAVQTLRDAFANAPAGPVVVNAAFFTAAGLTPPPDFDAAIKAAYRLADDSDGLSIDYDRSTVGAVTNDRFVIPALTLAFLEAPADKIAASLYGAAGTAATPLLAIDVVPGGWQLADQFPGMDPAGWPFDLLRLSQQRFLFASEAQDFASAALGTTLSLAAGQNLYGVLAVPAAVAPLFALIEGLGAVPPSLVACGAISLDKVDNAEILYPDMDLTAPIAAGSGLELFFLDVVNPHLGFVIETATDTEDEDGSLLIDADGEPTTMTFQTPYFYFGVEIDVVGTDGQTLKLAFRAMIADDASGYSFAIEPADPKHPITPQAVAVLMAGNSYFSAVPASLQQYLAAVQMQGFTLAGPLKPTPAVSSLTTMLGSVQGQPIKFFDDPTTGAAFEIDAFSLVWTINYSASDAHSSVRAIAAGETVTAGETSYFARFEATFKLFPTVFRTKDGQPGGLFEIAIDSNLDFEGSFTGSVTLNDALTAITQGAIGLPDAVSIGFSDIHLAVSPSRKTYSLSFQVDAFVDIPFIGHTDSATGDTKPLIQITGLVFDLNASTPNRPDGQAGTTVYAGSMDGQIVIGPVAANVRVDYDGKAETPVWTLDAALAQPLSLSDLIATFFRAYNLPDFLPGDLVIETLTVNATIPVAPKTARLSAARASATRPARRAAGAHQGIGWRSPIRPAHSQVTTRRLQEPSGRLMLLTVDPPATTKPAYKIAARIRWAFHLTQDIPVDILAELGLDYDGNRKAGEEFAGSVIGTIEIADIGPVQIGYSFGPPVKADGSPDLAALALLPRGTQLDAAAFAANSTLWMSWKGFRAEYKSDEKDNKSVTFSLSGWTVGGLITALVEMIGDPYFTLPSPWDILNQISLDGFLLTIDLTPNAKNRVSVSYKLPSPIDLGILKINGLQFLQVDGKVQLAIDGSTIIPSAQASPLFDPSKGGQDVNDMPKVPGRGNAYFDLKLLALGQRIKIHDPGSFDSTAAVIKALETIPPSTDGTMPFDPTQRVKGQPYYDASSNWLGALHLGLLRIGDTPVYAIDCMIVFNDPDLYGLRVALNGDKMKVLAGLAIDVLYKKITDDIGCYQIEFTLPSALRNLDFGAVSVTLPSIGLQIYTNGDFLVDFGFPYNMDFSRSFTVQAIIYGVPVLGSGGFYFGKLSNATAPGLPPTTRGTFHPVIVFGLGAQLGIGRTIDKGILKAGFSITVFGIIEGTIAAWHPFETDNRGNGNEVQGDYYFKISGTFGIIGKLFGSVDFAVIKADVSLTVIVYAKISYESYRKIPLVLSASVQVSVSIKIDLGLFSIKISFSFSASITEELTIGSDGTAPWDDPHSALAATALLGRDGAIAVQRARPLPRTLFELGIVGRPLSLDFAKPHALLRASLNGAPVPLKLTALTQFTILGAEGADYGQQEAALVLLFAMDAPTADGGAGDGADTSFGRLCGALLPWIIASVVPETDVPLAAPGDGTVSRPLLEGILKALADPAKAPFDAKQLVDFLAANFAVTVTAADATLAKARRDDLDAGTTIFPALACLSMTVPDPAAATGDTTIAYDSYVKATAAYQAELRKIFNTVAANVQSESGTPAPSLAAVADDPEPMAASVFTDYFILLARQLVQSGIDSFDDYPYKLTTATSLQTILDWANALAPGQLTALDLVNANLAYPLAPKLALRFADIDYMVQTGDTLAAIAARYNDAAVAGSTDSAGLIIANAARSNLLAVGETVTIVVDGVTHSHVVAIGEGFAQLAAGLGVTLDVLSAQTGVYTQPGLLAPGIVMTIPNVTVTSVAGDTIGGLIGRLAVPAASFLTPSNLALAGLFVVDPTLRFAVPSLLTLPDTALWPAILSAGTLGQTAGMSARYMMHGMRLPVEAGLALPSNFLYGPPHWTGKQSGFGAYQLTGQQFPLAERTDAYPISLSRPETEDFKWLTLGTGSSLGWDIIAQTSLAGQVLASAQKQGYRPAIPLLEPERATLLAPRRYGMASHATWTTSDAARLASVTHAPALRTAALAAASDTPQARPLLFGLSGALLSAVEAAQASLAGSIATVKDLAPYLPVLAPSVSRTDPATRKTVSTDIDSYCLATRVDFRIKRLAQDADLAPERPDANAVVPPGPGNPGSPARPLAPFAYEIIGPSPSDAVLLERLLTAMASEGEALVSGLFLLYGDVNSGAPGLTSRAESEFLSFIVQSNLSTETNPPPAVGLRALASGDALPTGIVNKTAEFIKLLWELSTVNSGGTYLFYQMLADGTGLPPSLFDTSGVATLTLVATISRTGLAGTSGAPAKGARLFNAVNALVTTAPIDPDSAVVELTGVSAPVASLPLPTDSTLAGLAASYGVDLGGLVSTNADAPLATGSLIPISGLYHQLLPTDVGTGKDPLAALAAYYSVGVYPPLVADDIAKHNPGVPVEALAVLRIPDFTYAVGATGPGSSFNAMAAYYQADVTALGYAARDVPNLFVGPTLTIDPIAWDATPSLGNGNVGLTVERERGSEPVSPPTDIDSYTRATLLQLYQLLSAGISANALFAASVDSAPFGPKDPPPSEAGPAVGARLLAASIAAPAADQPYLYDQAIGFTNASPINPAPQPKSAGLPPASANPYVGIGSILQFRLAWQDLFGNRTPSPFSRPQSSDSPPFGDVPAPILYADRPMPLDQWPSTTRAYRYSGAAGAPSLSILLKFDPTPYEPADSETRAHLNAVRFGDTVPVWQRNAVADLAKFQLVYFQLNQDYGALNIPGLSGPAITMSLVNSLLADPEAKLPIAARDQVLAYVDAAVIYLAARAAGTAATPPADVTISLPIALSALAADSDIIRLELAIRFTRQSRLVDPILRGLADGLTVTSTIPVDGTLPAPPKKADDPAAADDAPLYPVGLAKFAADFETAFATADWQMRIGTSAADPSTPSNLRTPSIWAVRMAVADSSAPQGIGFSIGNDPRYFAPLPIASSLQTLTVGVNSYASGKPYPDGAPVATTFTSVDPNVWLAESLSAIDDILTASYSTPLFLLDRLLKLDQRPVPGDASAADAETFGYLPRMLAHKQKLASAIASTATSVLDQPDERLKPAAKAKLEQALLRRLGNATSLTCVAVLPVTQAHYGQKLPEGTPAPRFYGQPQGTLPDGETTGSNSNFSLSTAKIPLNPEKDDETSNLAFLVTSRSTASQAYVSLDLAFALSHLEHDIRSVPGIERYEQSRWISFLTGPFVNPITPKTGKSFDIPVALRALPTPATVVAQTGTPHAEDPTTVPPGDLKMWDYGFSYLLNQAAQDSVMAEVVFNQPSGEQLAGPDPTPATLYAALAQFTAVYPAIARDIETYLRLLDGRSEAGSADATAAAFAVAALEAVTADVSTAYDNWAKARTLAAFVGAPPPPVAYRFEIVLEAELSAAPQIAGAEPEARVEIRPQSFLLAGKPADNFLPLATVLIDPDNYDPDLVASDPATGGATWRYLRKQDPKDPEVPAVLPYAAARLNAAREIRFEGLDLFALQSGWAAVEVLRNRHLSPDLAVATTAQFEFATAASRFADPLVPLLDVATYALDKDRTAPASVGDFLTGFFGALLPPAAGVPFTESVLVKIETRYGYSLVPAATGIDVPLTVLPVSLLAPASTEGSSAPAFVGEVGALAQSWFKGTQPVTAAPAGFDFAVTVFSGTGASTLPLLRIEQLTLAASSIKSD
ncbi:LysM peptidoglycan-binding domain-containing protein [Aurantimonas endophytica]|uniref:LysM domain-containing protein n=1 Tax=Aurantimonas endophytica TaxID=1522175 RepID=A0A7W6MPP7_9HYPH|nr:LysM domain-containing protein [Aurantimonas endophytica]MBB4003107.1 hypothetical protein [Aurantimonas endophytica]MCO6403979.1 LysM peptidoglycan-binding domain-containing protein [Aurantimonas endophytica]